MKLTEMKLKGINMKMKIALVIIFHISAEGGAHQLVWLDAVP